MRAGIVERPEQHRWRSLGHHVRTSNADGFLSLDLGLPSFAEGGAKGTLIRGAEGR